MSRHLLKFLPLFFLFANIAFGQTPVKKEAGIGPPPPPVISGWKTINQGSYSIEYPYTTWILDQSGQMGTSLIIYAPLDSTQGKLRPNINILIQDLTGMDINLDKYTEISEGQIKKMMKKAELIESKRIKKESGEHQKIIFKAEQNDIQLQFEQYYFVADNKAYVLTYTNEQIRFEDLKEISEQIFNTFKLKK